MTNQEQGEAPSIWGRMFGGKAKGAHAQAGPADSAGAAGAAGAAGVEGSAGSAGAAGAAGVVGAAGAAGVEGSAGVVGSAGATDVFASAGSTDDEAGRTEVFAPVQLGAQPGVQSDSPTGATTGGVDALGSAGSADAMDAMDAMDATIPGADARDRRTPAANPSVANPPIANPSPDQTATQVFEPVQVGPGAANPYPGAYPADALGGPVSHAPRAQSAMVAQDVSAWYGGHKALDRISLDMRAGEITALIGPSGCGKSTFLRILNRMHELIPGAELSGQVMLDGGDIYSAERKITEVRRDIGMVFQKPNPFPAMSIYDNVIAGLKMTGVKPVVSERDMIVERSLQRAGLWNEVKDRLAEPGGGLSGGQQQRLCIARALAVEPKVLLMDEPCSALDPTSTRVIEETMVEMRRDVTIVIVTHNMQQAERVSQRCAFFLASLGTPGQIVEYGETQAMFHHPQDSRTYDYVNGNFG